jgi:hypothetical protein
MEDPANELRRIPLPRTWVHKEKPRVFVQQALSSGDYDRSDRRSLPQSVRALPSATRHLWLRRSKPSTSRERLYIPEFVL